MSFETKRMTAVTLGTLWVAANTALFITIPAWAGWEGRNAEMWYSTGWALIGGLAATPFLIYSQYREQGV